MKSLAHIASAFLSEPWGILPTEHAAMGQILAAHMRGERPTTDQQLLASASRPALSDWQPRGDIVVGPCDEDGNPIIPQMQKLGRLAVIPVFGVTGRHLSFLSLWCGGCDYTHIEQMAMLAEADPNIDTVVFYFRSPGGIGIGCEECGDVIAGMRKATIAFSDHQCCSCAYWLAAACDQVIFSPSAMTSNIGVFIAMLDNSAEWEAQGWRRELFRSGPLKASGISGKPWTDIERRAMQARVDGLFATFRAHVETHRPGCDPAAFDGAWVTGREAASMQLSDGIAPSLESVLAALA